ncbi:hypothetical protein KIH39_22760 [Telmatocola sphagniphila]|uniref:Uncharacterized protein n=1 Tax=Telmatocola sphagniphila TaxID=1123043 RepID=A0A8E6B4K0_9BACT|nr:hypothetical protein [Telmatocola sphagniphila]QVL31636.1 hypothetical protein KIH39_22760 [Telmatocola sphagniphila]
MLPIDDEIWDDLFHGCAWSAFVEQARRGQDWPKSEVTRQRAYQLYEDELARRNRRKGKNISSG